MSYIDSTALILLVAVLGYFRTLALPTSAAAKPMSSPPSIPQPGASPRIGLPIEGIRSKDLRDSFYESHNGHRHEAIDLMAPRGTRVLAVTEGRIEKLFVSKAGGKTIYEFDDSSTYCYYYAHLDHYADGIIEGHHVSPGNLIGYVGSTGNASPNAPHLHFAIYRLGSEPLWWTGVPIDPYPALVASANDAH